MIPNMRLPTKVKRTSIPVFGALLFALLSHHEEWNISSTYLYSLSSREKAVVAVSNNDSEKAPRLQLLEGTGGQQKMPSDSDQRSQHALLLWLQNMTRISPPPPLCSKAEASWQECIADDPTTIDVILTIWKRRSLHFQLRSLASQSFKPSHVYIVQSKDFLRHVFIQKSVREFSESTSQSIPVDIIHSSADQGYHGRFHIAYALSNATYVSIWDDDVAAEPGYLEFCVNYSKARNDALVGGDGRIFNQLLAGWRSSTTKKNIGYNFAKEQDIRKDNESVDYAANAWTLRRDFLRFYLGSTVYTYATGEDMQLAFALQRQGIKVETPDPPKGYQLQNIKQLFRDSYASWIFKSQEPRQWLICKIMQSGFRPVNCSNCDEETIRRCLYYFGDKNVMPTFGNGSAFPSNNSHTPD
jgi:hypothetical protein